MKQYDIVVFDLDGTLLDTSEGVIKSLDYTIAKMGLRSLNTEEKYTFIGPPITQSLKKKYKLTEEQSREAIKIFRERYKNYDCLLCEPYPNTFDLLKKLKENNILIGVATYKREDYAIKILEHIGIANYCDCIKGADYQGVLTKTDILNKCLENLGCKDYSKVIFIGDSEYDAMGAANVGVKFIGVTYGYGFNDKSCLKEYEDIDFLDTVNEIIRYLC